MVQQGHQASGESTGRDSGDDGARARLSDSGILNDAGGEAPRQ